MSVIPREQHAISRKDISENALKVLYRLNKAGYEAYLVGGGVRDLLLGKKPKDFDVTTSATPEQVRKLFRNCRLVGRRFRLAHVMFGPEIIEVATFRGHHEATSTIARLPSAAKTACCCATTSSALSKKMPSVAISPSTAFTTAWRTLPYAITLAACRI
ncbi:hypothetical protein ACNKHO_01040 [Shigella flexneri]